MQQSWDGAAKSQGQVWGGKTRDGKESSSHGRGCGEAENGGRYSEEGGSSGQGIRERGQSQVDGLP